jgi:hypothetical protein
MSRHTQSREKTRASFFKGNKSSKARRAKN